MFMSMRMRWLSPFFKDLNHMNGVGVESIRLYVYMCGYVNVHVLPALYVCAYARVVRAFVRDEIRKPFFIRSIFVL